MNDPAPIDVALQRRRLAVMLGINGICVVVAIAAAIGFLHNHVAWLGVLFAAAVLAGFGAHIWLVLGLRRKG
ncbi:MAG TPA: hypothetical protein VGI79_13485 [Caulobacteraceae bacterium]|jgi:CHASE2 domain-containing sensor protein